MKRRRRRYEESDSVEINLTPLIDVVFVILIVFIIIAPMLEIEKLQLSEGASSEAKTLVSFQKQSPLKIEVKADNTIWVGKQCIRHEDLKGILLIEKAKEPSAVPQLFQDKRSSFGVYQQVKNILEESGFDTVDLVLQPSGK